MDVNTKDLVTRQRKFFQSGKTRSLSFRRAQLEKLRQAIKTLEPEIYQALAKDLRKSPFEAYGSEIGFVYEELKIVLNGLSEWAEPQCIGTPLPLMPGSSKVYPEPKGVILIIGPWNYPFQLIIAPVIGAIAAGNCVILKPSEVASETEAVVEKLIQSAFSPEYCAVVRGDATKTKTLLNESFDHIFFTGSVAVGREVMLAAAHHLTPVTLELGGKSPCIVDETADITVTARRIAWGKFLNVGQTCVAPDYLLVHEKAHAALITALRQELQTFYGSDPKESPDYGRIINRRHFDRLKALLVGSIVVGGASDPDDLYIAPTIIDQVDLTHPAMQDEIFGPILPVITFKNLDEAFGLIAKNPKPLALYIFTSNKTTEQRVISEVSFGGGCVNNTILHLANVNLPFGGIGTSGIGSYHGKASFDVFSHFKSIYKTPYIFDLKVKYPPYKDNLKYLKHLIG